MFCPNCSAQIPDGSPSCPNCGAIFSGNVEATAAVPTFDAQDIEKNKGVVILTALFNNYFWIPLLYDKKSPYGMFYANNAVMLIILSAIASLVSGILFWTVIVPIAASVLLMVLWIMNLVYAIKGYQKPLPLIGKYVIFRAKED